MTAGDARSDAPGMGDVVRMIQSQVGLRYFLSQPPIISRKFLVPYGAGRSMDGSMVYIDEGVPLRFKMGVEPDKYVSGHEGFEWWLMTRLDKDYWRGPNVRSAHYWATGFEHMLLKLDGWSDAEIDAYEDEWRTYVSEDEAQRITPETVPPDLYAGPYEPGEDEGESMAEARILPILLAARARVLQAQAVRVT
ncbi:MAG: hypothetical protein ABR863_12750 [Roseiarcus sp.]|jgi:hypothetical protein